MSPLETTLPDQPLIQAQLLLAIGQTYQGLGLYEKTVAVFERARNLYRDELGTDMNGRLAPTETLMYH